MIIVRDIYEEEWEIIILNVRMTTLHGRAFSLPR